mgnify:CR=1
NKNIRPTKNIFSSFVDNDHGYPWSLDRKRIQSYKKALDQNLLPSFRGMKLNEDDKIRQHATQQIRSYFKIDYKNFKEQFDINGKDYFK